MVTVNLAGGGTMDIPADEVVRIRRTGPVETPHGNTRIDWSIVSYVMDEASDVASAVAAEMNTPSNLGQLNTPGLGPLWFFGPASKGPIHLPQQWLTNGIKSMLIIANMKQYVSDEPGVVAQVVHDAGGESFSVISNSLAEWDTVA